MNDIQSKVDIINFVHSCANKWIPILSEYFLQNYNGKKIVKNDKGDYYTEVYKNMPKPFFYDSRRRELDRESLYVSYNSYKIQHYNLVIAEETKGNMHVKLIHLRRHTHPTFEINLVNFSYNIRFRIGENRFKANDKTRIDELLFNHNTEYNYNGYKDKFNYINLSQLPLRTDYTVELVQQMHDEAFECIKKNHDNAKIYDLQLKELQDQYLAAKEVLRSKFINDAESVQNREKIASLINSLDTSFVIAEFLPKEQPFKGEAKNF